MSGFWPMAALALATWASRSVFIMAFGSREVPPRLERALRNVGPAVLAALVGSLVVGTDGWSGLGFSPTLLALVVAAAVAWRTKNMMWTLFAGMAAVWIATPLWP